MTHAWTHAWCTDVSRDAAVRAAEDAAASERPPLPEWRDFPRELAALREEAAALAAKVAAMKHDAAAAAVPPQAGSREDGGEAYTDSASVGTANTSGLRTERVTLEITQLAEGFVPLSEWCWHGLRHWGASSVRVVSDEERGRDMGNGVFVASVSEVHAMYGETVNLLTAERDAAIREREEAIAESERLRAERNAAINCVDEVNKSADAEVQRLRVALADAIRRPMGVIPESADGLVTQKELDEAEIRRPRNIPRTVLVEQLTDERDAAVRERESWKLLADRANEARDTLQARVADLESQLESVACRAATAETALEEIKSLDFTRAAVNGAAWQANNIASKALEAASGGNQTNQPLADGGRLREEPAESATADSSPSLSLDTPGAPADGAAPTASGGNGQGTLDGSTQAASGDNSSAKPRSSRHTERDFPPPDAFVDALHDPVGPTSGKRIRAKKLTLAASGGEQEPVAWEYDIHTPHGTGRGVSNLDPKKHPEVWEEATGVPATDARPLYRSPPPPRGWLTERDRKTLIDAVVFLSGKGERGMSEAIEWILARSSPPEVVLDALPTDESGELFSRHDVIAALAAAGVKVKEVK